MNDKYPFPDFAQGMSQAEMRRRNQWHQPFHWKLLLGIGVFWAVCAYSPWTWVAHWPVVSSFVDAATYVFPFIRHGAATMTHMPPDAIATQLTFLSVVSLVGVASWLITRPHPVLREVPMGRLFVPTLWFGFLAVCCIAFIFFLGRGEVPRGETANASSETVVFRFLLVWWGLGATLNFAIAPMREFVRRIKQGY